MVRGAIGVGRGGWGQVEGDCVGVGDARVGLVNAGGLGPEWVTSFGERDWVKV